MCFKTSRQVRFYRLQFGSSVNCQVSTSPRSQIYRVYLQEDNNTKISGDLQLKSLSSTSDRHEKNEIDLVDMAIQEPKQT